MKNNTTLSARFWLLIAIACAGFRGAALTVSLNPVPPVPGPYDMYNFAGADMDMNNVYQTGSAPATNGAANDAFTYVANDRASQGQTFTTGTGSGGYLLTDIWVKHVGYAANTVGDGNGTWWQMAGGGNLTLRVTKPSQAGGAGFALSSETYPASGAEGWLGGGSLNGDGMWVHLALASPVLLATNTTYGFDLTSVIKNNIYFEWLGNKTNVHSGGSAYKGNTAGAPDNTLTPLVGDRVFLLQLMPQAHPRLKVGMAGDSVHISWPATNLSYLLQYATNVNGPWAFSGTPVSTLNGTNYVTDAPAEGAVFYRLQYANSAQFAPVISWQTNSDGLTFQLNRGTLKLQVFSPHVVRVAYSLSNSVPTNSFAVVATGTGSGWNTSVSPGEVVLATSALRVRVNRVMGTVGFYDANGNALLTEPVTGGRTLTPAVVGGFNTLQSQQRFVITPTEGIYGLGEHPAGIMNYRGSSVHLQNVNASQGSNPVLVSSRGYGLFWDNPAISDVSVAQSSPTDLTWTSEAATAVDYYFMYGPALDDVIGGYRNLTGNAPMFGKWAWGLWQCKNRYLTQSELLTAVAAYRSLNIPLDGIIQDWFYWTENANQFGSHRFDPARYPNPAQMVQSVHSNNLHMLISVWARFDTNLYNAQALRAVNGLYTNVLPNVYPVGVGQWYDPFNSSARQVYWDEIATNLFNLGIDGWWFDASEGEFSGNWGEYRSFSTAAGPGAQVFNAYPLMHTASAYAGQRATNSAKRVFILTRSSWAGQQRNAAVTWTGDIGADFTVLSQQIPAGLNFAISGVPYWTTDTGGFWDDSPSNPAYAELFTRWFQFSTFCPMLRIHGNNDKAIYNFPAATQTVLTNFVHLRYHLLPYIYSTAWQVTSAGYTMMRPLVMDFQSDTNVFGIKDQFMFGPALMACPVTTSNVVARNVYLPGGAIWYDFWTGQAYAAGQTISATATIDRMPIQVRAGSIIPYGPAIQYAAQANDPIELRVYRGANGSFTLYEDENDNYNYESGFYATIPITWDESSQTLAIGARQGSFPGMLVNRTFRVVWVGAGHGVGVANTSTVDRIMSYNGAAVQVSP